MAARPKPVGSLVMAALIAPGGAGSNPVPSSATSSTILSRCR